VPLGRTSELFADAGFHVGARCRCHSIELSSLGVTLQGFIEELLFQLIKPGAKTRQLLARQRRNRLLDVLYLCDGCTLAWAAELEDRRMSIIVKPMRSMTGTIDNRGPGARQCGSTGTT
jgi:hypothetical protein